MGQARQPVTVNQLSNFAKKKIRGENFVTTLKDEVFPAKWSPGEAPPPLYALDGRRVGQDSPHLPPMMCEEKGSNIA